MVNGSQPTSISSIYACPDIPLKVFQRLHKLTLDLEHMRVESDLIKTGPRWSELQTQMRKAQKELAGQVQGKVFIFLNEIGCAPDVSAFRMALNGELQDQCVPRPCLKT